LWAGGFEEFPGFAVGGIEGGNAEGTDWVGEEEEYFSGVGVVSPDEEEFTFLVVLGEGGGGHRRGGLGVSVY